MLRENPKFFSCVMMQFISYLVWFQEKTRFVDGETVIVLSAFVQVDFEAARSYWVGAGSSVVALGVAVGHGRYCVVGWSKHIRHYSIHICLGI
jgi:hypothetical protein